MASINISEGDFQAVAGAAFEAQRSGNMEDARALDKIARKMNAALSNGAISEAVGRGTPRMTKAPRWQDMPSILKEPQP